MTHRARTVATEAVSDPTLLRAAKMAHDSAYRCIAQAAEAELTQALQAEWLTQI